MLTTKDARPSSLATPSPVSPGLTARTPSCLGPGIQIKGEITSDEDLRLEGKVEGPISLGGNRLTVGGSAHVRADIVAREVSVAGEVTGNVTARERIEIKKGGSIMGDLSTARLAIEDGAFFKGSIEIDTRNTPGGVDLGAPFSRTTTAGQKPE